MGVVWRAYREMWEDDPLDAVFATFMLLLSVAMVLLVALLFVGVLTSGGSDCAVTPQ